MGAASVNSTNYGLKILGGGKSRKFPKAKLKFAGASNYLHSIYFVLGVINNLEMI